MEIPSNLQQELDRLWAKYQQDLDAITEYACGLVEEVAGNADDTLEVIKDYTSAASQAANEYYDTVRTVWEKAGVDLPAFEHDNLIDLRRALRQVQGGFSNTDFNGLTYKQVISGEVHSGMTIWDLLPDITNVDTAQQLVADMIHSAARLTTQRNMRLDPTSPRWARVPSGETCEFCLMLASRGFAYTSEKTAGREMQYHSDCDCRIVPSWGKQTLAGYDPDGLYARYKACADTVAPMTTRERYDAYKKTLAARGGEELRDYESWKCSIELAEMRWRDRHWLNTGELPEITFASPKVEQEILKKRPHELRTAQRLRLCGVQCHFIEDELHIRRGNETVTVGLSDLAGGIELKTLLKAGSANTIESHLRSLRTKSDCRRVIFDNHENDQMDDASLIDILTRSKRFGRGSVYVLTGTERLMKVR